MTLEQRWRWKRAYRGRKGTDKRGSGLIFLRDTNNSSYAGLTRVSILQSEFKKMDCRVKPGNDDEEGSKPCFLVFGSGGADPSPSSSASLRKATCCCAAPYG